MEKKLNKSDKFTNNSKARLTLTKNCVEDSKELAGAGRRCSVSVADESERESAKIERA